MTVPPGSGGIAGRCDNATTPSPGSKSDKCDKSDKSNKSDRPDEKKRRRWAVCAAKVKSGALKLKGLVNSSDSSDSESDCDGGRNSGSGSGADSGFGENFPCPFPLKSSGSFSFSDGPTVLVATASDPAETPTRAVSEPCLPVATSWDVNAVTGARSIAGDAVRDCAGDCTREDVGPLSGSSGPVGEAWVESVSLAERAGTGEEEAREAAESPVWELSSSSEENNDPSPTRSRSRLISRSGDRNIDYEHRNGQARSPCPSSPPRPPFSSRPALPESPGSYVPRMHKILAHVQQTTAATAPATSAGSACMAEAGDGDNNSKKSPAHRKHSSLCSCSASNGETVARRTTVVSGTAVDGGAVAKGGAVAPVSGCRGGADRLEQTERCEASVAGEAVGVEADVAPVKETPDSKSTPLDHRHRQQQQQQQPDVFEQQQLRKVVKETEPYGDEEEVVYCQAPVGRRDLEVMIAAVSAMVGMMIPERYQWMLWLVCCAVTVWFPLQKRLRWPFSRRTSPERMLSPPPFRQSSRAILNGDGEEDDEPPPPYVDMDVGVDGMGAGQAEESFGCPQANGSRGGVPLVRGPSRKVVTQASRDGGLGMGDDSVNGNEEGEAEGSSQRYSQMVTGLSETEREFVGSAGEEEKNRLLHQCLEYANYDVGEAIKVCRNFCKFRLNEGWDLVLSARDVEGPLRSRAHTLVAARDRIGRGMLTFSPGKLDTKKAPPAAYHKMLCYVLQEVLKEREDLQTKGLVLLVDARGVSLGLLRHFTFADYTRGIRMLGGAFPAKLKAIRILHLNRAIKIALSIAMPLFSAKMRARVEIVSSERASVGSFTTELADPSCVPVELGVQGTWLGSDEFWSKWVDARVNADKPPDN